MKRVLKGLKWGLYIGVYGGERKQVEHEMGSTCVLGFTRDLGKLDESGKFLI